jgi:hypothetical protein
LIYSDISRYKTKINDEFTTNPLTRETSTDEQIRCDGEEKKARTYRILNSGGRSFYPSSIDLSIDHKDPSMAAKL